MRVSVKKFLIFMLVVLMLATWSLNGEARESIELALNYAVNLVFNGNSVDAGEILNINGTTYVPLQTIVKIFGADYSWDEKSKTASIDFDITNVSKKTLANRINPYNPQIMFSDIDLLESTVDVAKLEANGEKIFINIETSGGYLGFVNAQADFGGNILELNTEYLLSIYTVTGKKHEVSFKTSGLPTLVPKKERQVFLIPAMPEKGFHWPYFLVLPSEQYKYQNDNLTSKRYLFVEPVNNGLDTNLDLFLNKLSSEYEKTLLGRQNGLNYAEPLWSPYIMPIFPRADVSYQEELGYSWFYTHALDRSSATLHIMRKNKSLESELTAEFEKGNFNIDDFERLDKQVYSMIDHAIAYLNKYGFGVEEKVFLYGFSAQGTFVDRFATLHPEKIKAYGSGATLDDMLIPLDVYKGKKLVFPIGVYDYKEIVGRKFNLELHNQVARVIHMGADDNNNVILFSDSYGEAERRIITNLWGIDVLPRAKSLIELYGASGGVGMFILDKGETHGSSYEMQNYLKEFFMANRNSSVPVYPMPSNKNQLMYTLHSDF